VHTTWNRLDNWSQRWGAFAKASLPCMNSLSFFLSPSMIPAAIDALMLHLSYRGYHQRLGSTSCSLPVSCAWFPLPSFSIASRFLSLESLLCLPILYNLTHLSHLSDLHHNSLLSPSNLLYHPCDIVLCLLIPRHLGLVTRTSFSFAPQLRLVHSLTLSAGTRLHVVNGTNTRHYKRGPLGLRLLCQLGLFVKGQGP